MSDDTTPDGPRYPLGRHHRDETTTQPGRALGELTRIPNDEILELYEAPRPGRSTYYQLLSLSQQLASRYGAEHTGAYIRESAEAYRETGLLKMDEC